VDDPQTGAELVASFYQADGDVFDQCDDSGGDVGIVFRFDAKQLFGVKSVTSCRIKAVCTLEGAIASNSSRASF